MLIPMTYVRTMTQYEVKSGLFCLSFLHEYARRVMLTSVQRVETSTGLYEIYIIYNGKPADLYKHVERNVMLHIRLTL
jgi:hypothetical protein